MGTLRVALLGCGGVGSQVARLLVENADDIAARAGAAVELVGIAVRRERTDHDDLGIDPSLFTTDADALVRRDDVDLVVEVIGGIEPARSLILAAMEHGASVVSANKALLAEDAEALHEAADKHGVDLFYEASVAGAIPLLRPLRESLAGDRVTRVLGIVNGTTNYILDQMDTHGSGFADALGDAQALGYAEADPTADIEGYDAAAKAAILAGIVFHTPVTAADVYREGISGVTAAEVAAAQEMNAVIKLLAICEVSADGRVGARVHPAMLPRTHPLASVRDAYNAVFVEAQSAGRLMFYGPGAGGAPTASAVLGDLVSAARNRVIGGIGAGGSWYADRPVRSMGDTLTRYHISLDVDDRPGVLAAVAAVFADHDVSIETVRQVADTDRDDAELVIVTHQATDDALMATVEGLAALDTVRSVASVLRVEGE